MRKKLENHPNIDVSFEVDDMHLLFDTATQVWHDTLDNIAYQIDCVINDLDKKKYKEARDMLEELYQEIK